MMEEVKKKDKEYINDDMYKIVVFNDNKNTFDHVVFCFIAILNHDPIQANQCAQIIHNTGKYAVKVGKFDKLERYCTKLIELGLDATITI